MMAATIKSHRRSERPQENHAPRITALTTRLRAFRGDSFTRIAYKFAKKIATMSASTSTFPFAVKGQSGAIPQLGFGTATLKGDKCIAAVTTALAAGYRHLARS